MLHRNPVPPSPRSSWTGRGEPDSPISESPGFSSASGIVLHQNQSCLNVLNHKLVPFFTYHLKVLQDHIPVLLSVLFCQASASPNFPFCEVRCSNSVSSSNSTQHPGMLWGLHEISGKSKQCPAELYWGPRHKENCVVFICLPKYPPTFWAKCKK